MNIPMHIHLLLMVFFSFALVQKEETIINSFEPSVEIGEQIYSSGIGDGDNKVIANVSGRDLSGTMMACVNCHGNCGKGVVLQGVKIPDIRKAKYIERHLIGVSPNNIEKKVISKYKKAIALGIKHDGKKMHNLMPRYKMSISDMNHLLAFLAVLGENDECIKE